MGDPLSPAGRTGGRARALAVGGRAARPTDDLAGLRALLHHDGEALDIAEDRSRLAGSVIAAWDGWRGALYRLAVLPGYRRRGVGRALVEAGEQRLLAASVRRVGVLAVRDEAAAEPFWVSGGYRPDKGVVRFVRDL